MEQEALLIDTKPSAVILIPHLCLMLIFIGFITIWKPLFGMISTTLRVTTKRVSAKKGIIHTENMDSPLSKVTSVKVTQGILGKVFNYGTIIIGTANGDYSFDYIPDADNIKNIIMKNIGY